MEPLVSLCSAVMSYKQQLHIHHNYCLLFKTFQDRVVFFSFVLCSMCIL